MKGSTFITICLIATGALLLASCDKNRVFEENKQIKRYWSKDSLARFEANIDDSISTNNIYVTVRNSSSYPYSNLYLFVTTVAPSGAYVRDTLECILADDTGKWQGKGFAKYWDHRFAIRKKVKFPEKGVYSFSVEQGMRLDELPGIDNVGIRIERVEQ